MRFPCPGVRRRASIRKLESGFDSVFQESSDPRRLIRSTCSAPVASRPSVTETPLLPMVQRPRSSITLVSLADTSAEDAALPWRTASAKPAINTAPVRLARASRCPNLRRKGLLKSELAARTQESRQRPDPLDQHLSELPRDGRVPELFADEADLSDVVRLVEAAKCNQIGQALDARYRTPRHGRHEAIAGNGGEGIAHGDVRGIPRGFDRSSRRIACSILKR